jgi:hypothetical protein
MGFFSNMKDKFSGPKYDDLEAEQGYLELDTEQEDSRSKIIVRPLDRKSVV